MYGKVDFMSEIGSNFVEILKRKNLRKSDISKATGIAHSCFTDWAHGRYTPKRDKLYKIAEYLDVPVSYLIDDSLDVTELFDEDFKQKEMLLDYFVKLNDSDKNFVVEMVKNMADRNKLYEEYMSRIMSAKDEK